VLALFDVVARWLHLMASVVWLGGITFILFVAIPSAKQVLGTEAARLLGEVSKKFTRLANSSILALVITGALIMALGGQPTGHKPLGSAWPLALITKHALVLGMVTIHFFRGLVLVPKIQRATAEADRQALAKLSLNLVKVNWGLGMLVLLLSGMAALP
jgi:uncharacterized membrane protein